MYYYIVTEKNLNYGDFFSKININSLKSSKFGYSVHGPDPTLFPACSAKLDSETALWMLLKDKNPTSFMLPCWSDYIYCDPY